MTRTELDTKCNELLRECDIECDKIYAKLPKRVGLDGAIPDEVKKIKEETKSKIATLYEEYKSSAN